MSRLLSTAISGMAAHASGIDITGNNIANLNTSGFKSSRPGFATLFSQTLRAARGVSDGVTGLNPVQAGAGVQLATNTTQFQQGTLTYTGQNLDLAIMGNGFFQLKDGMGEAAYTRDGAFTLQSDGTMVHAASGLKVQGLLFDIGTGTVPAGAVPEDIVIPPGLTLNAKATGEVTMAGNLDAAAATGDIAEMQYRYYDSFGVPHQMDLTYTKTANPREWSWVAQVGANNVGSGTLTFTAEGDVASGGTGTATVTVANGGVTAGGTDPQAISIDMARLTQYGAGSELEATNQDGFEPGFLIDIGTDDQGHITAMFSNGLTRPVAQLSLANFANVQGLARTVGNLFKPTANTGLAQLLTPGTAGVGTIQSQSLERSNVDLPSELTQMIVFQRGYQASARLVTTADEILQEALNLKR